LVVNFIMIDGQGKHLSLIKKIEVGDYE
jgi:hypothetical protein